MPVGGDRSSRCGRPSRADSAGRPLLRLDEAVEIRDDTEYRFSVSVHAGDLGTGMEIAGRMDTGSVHVDDQPIDEVHATSSGTEAFGVGACDGTDTVDELAQ